MLVGDLIYNGDFDINCNYVVYDCRNGEQWHEASVIWSTEKNGYHKPLDKILDMHVGYITINNNELIIEAI